ncbi:hypothetical protein M422DRAFT_265313 [Sphaerobolus stellatus SS14]|uniref:Uncharacterized protein n=1 Tax=Sphaerobolus stellatus (strain SS14) TaxID=990650 RepID=A0A0C9UDQ1_SPHS4|nr:hypothetical protein M422DRAFT_265313 [Sphaerobolus stellatus SS14]
MGDQTWQEENRGSTSIENDLDVFLGLPEFLTLWPPSYNANLGERASTQLSGHAKLANLASKMHVREDAAGTSRLWWNDNDDEVVFNVQGFLAVCDLPTFGPRYRFKGNPLSASQEVLLFTGPLVPQFGNTMNVVRSILISGDWGFSRAYI